MCQDALLLLALCQFALSLAIGLLDLHDTISPFVKDRQVYSLGQNILKAVSARAIQNMHIIIILLHPQKVKNIYNDISYVVWGGSNKYLKL